MRWNVIFTIQGLLLASGLYATTLWPTESEPALLVPILPPESKGPWRWVAAENVNVLNVDPRTGRITVIAGSQPALARALVYGLLPVRTTGAGCFEKEASKREEN